MEADFHSHTGSQEETNESLIENGLLALYHAVWNLTNAHSTPAADHNQLIVPLRRYTSRGNTMPSSNLISPIVSWVRLLKEGSDTLSVSSVDVLPRHRSDDSVCGSLSVMQRCTWRVSRHCFCTQIQISAFRSAFKEVKLCFQKWVTPQPARQLFLVLVLYREE